MAAITEEKTNNILIVCIIKIVIDFIEKTAAAISSLEFARTEKTLPSITMNKKLYINGINQD